MLQNTWFYIGLLALQIVIIIFLLIKNNKTKKQNKKTEELLRNYKARLREDELDEAIRNERYKQVKSENDWKNSPYEVSYKDEEHVRGTGAVCVHFQCEGLIATKKYIINIKDELYLGKEKTNGIVFDEDDVEPKHLHFVRKGREMYVQNISTHSRVRLNRGKTKHDVTDVLIKLNDGDVLRFDNSEILVNLL